MLSRTPTSQCCCTGGSRQARPGVMLALVGVVKYLCRRVGWLLLDRSAGFSFCSLLSVAVGLMPRWLAAESTNACQCFFVVSLEEAEVDCGSVVTISQIKHVPMMGCPSLSPWAPWPFRGGPSSGCIHHCPSSYCPRSQSRPRTRASSTNGCKSPGRPPEPWR